MAKSTGKRPLNQEVQLHIGEADVEKLARAAEGQRNALRNAVIVRMGFTLTLRAAEYGLMTWGDIEWQRGEPVSVYVTRVKGSLSKRLPLSKKTRKALKAWRKANPDSIDLEPILMGENRGPISARAIRNTINLLGKRAGVLMRGKTRVNSHALRHGGCVEMVNKGIPAEHIQEHAGHRDIRSTAVYARMSTEVHAKRIKGVFA